MRYGRDLVLSKANMQRLVIYILVREVILLFHFHFIISLFFNGVCCTEHFTDLFQLFLVELIDNVKNTFLMLASILRFAHPHARTSPNFRILMLRETTVLRKDAFSCLTTSLACSVHVGGTNHPDLTSLLCESCQVFGRHERAGLRGAFPTRNLAFSFDILVKTLLLVRNNVRAILLEDLSLTLGALS